MGTKQRVIVTGGGGYIGTAVVPMLLERGYAVRVIDRCFFGHDLLPAHDDLEVVQEDSRRIPADAFNGVDYVIDLVALSNDPTGELFEKSTWGAASRPASSPHSSEPCSASTHRE